MPELALKDTFKAHAKEASAIFDFQRAINEAGLKSGSVAGAMKTGAIMAKDAQDNAADRAEKASKARASDTLLLQLLSDIDARILANEKQISKNELKILELEAEELLLSDLLARLEAGEIPLIEDGKFVNEDLEAIVARYEYLYGPVDRTDAAQIQTILDANLEEQNRLKRENIALERENEVLHEERRAAIEESNLSKEVKVKLSSQYAENEEAKIEISNTVESSGNNASIGNDGFSSIKFN